MDYFMCSQITGSSFNEGTTRFIKDTSREAGYLVRAKTRLEIRVEKRAEKIEQLRAIKDAELSRQCQILPLPTPAPMAMTRVFIELAQEVEMKEADNTISAKEFSLRLLRYKQLFSDMLRPILDQKTVRKFLFYSIYPQVDKLIDKAEAAVKKGTATEKINRYLAKQMTFLREQCQLTLRDCSRIPFANK